MRLLLLLSPPSPPLLLLLLQSKTIGEELGIGFLGIGFDPKWRIQDIPGVCGCACVFVFRGGSGRDSNSGRSSSSGIKPRAAAAVSCAKALHHTSEGLVEQTNNLQHGQAMHFSVVDCARMLLCCLLSTPLPLPPPYTQSMPQGPFCPVLITPTADHTNCCCYCCSTHTLPPQKQPCP